MGELGITVLSFRTSLIQELVLPADDPLAAVWVQRYPYGVPVQSATSLGNKFPSHCAFAPPFRDYFNRV